MTILTNVTFANYVYEPSLGVGRQSVWFSMVHRWAGAGVGEAGGTGGAGGNLSGVCRADMGGRWWCEGHGGTCGPGRGTRWPVGAVDGGKVGCMGRRWPDTTP